MTTITGPWHSVALSTTLQKTTAQLSSPFASSIPGYPALIISVLVMLTRTRSKTLSNTVMPAESTSEDDLLSSQSQSNSDALIPCSLDSNPSQDDPDPSDTLPDTITQQAAAATIHIHCPTANAIDLTGEPEAVGWSEAAARTVVHVLPCEIHYNGPAAVRQYFQPARVINPLLATAASSSSSAAASSPTTYITKESPSPAASVTASRAGADSSVDAAALASSAWYTAAFRGRQLTGEKVALPPNTIGLVIRDKQPNSALRSNRTSSSSSKRHRQAKRQPLSSAVDEESIVVEDGTDIVAVADGGEEEAESRVDWLVDGWYTDLTLWGRDADWKGADQGMLKRSVLDWPVIAAALHDVPLVELPLPMSRG